MDRCCVGVVVGLEMGRGDASALAERGYRGTQALINAFVQNKANVPGSQRICNYRGDSLLGEHLCHFVTWLCFTKQSQG
jgi:hypothetical protein